jgi:CheY-like chemotaxis protein
MNRILIIEDDKTKIDRLKSFFHNADMVLKESYHGGVLELKKNFTAYDFLILDMTIPLWEKGKNDLGGNYEQFGGEKVLREMKRKKIHLPTILFTMFDVFPTFQGNMTFEEIDNAFKSEFSEFYRGAVFYNANEENWKNDLLKIISEFKNYDE